MVYIFYVVSIISTDEPWNVAGQLHPNYQGRRQGATGPAPPLGRRRRPCDCSASSNRECVYREKCSWTAPEGILQRRKVPPKSLSNDDRKAPSLGEIAPSQPLPPPPSRFSKYAATHYTHKWDDKAPICFSNYGSSWSGLFMHALRGALLGPNHSAG